MSNFHNQSAVNEALNSLHRYIRSMHISVELPDFNEEAMEEYFNSSDTEQLAMFDKMIKAAAVEAIYSDQEIPKRYKEKVARRAAEELVQAFRGAKVEYEFASGKYGSGSQSVRRYEREKSLIGLCQKAAFFDKIKKNLPRQLTKQAAKHSVKAALATLGMGTGGLAGAAVGFVVGLAVDGICYLIPKPVKEKIKHKSWELAHKAASLVKKVGSEIAATPAFKKAKSIVETYVYPVVRPVYERAREAVVKTTAIVSNAVRKGWKKLKSMFA